MVVVVVTPQTYFHIVDMIISNSHIFSIVPYNFQLSNANVIKVFSQKQIGYQMSLDLFAAYYEQTELLISKSWYELSHTDNNMVLYRSASRSNIISSG